MNEYFLFNDIICWDILLDGEAWCDKTGELLGLLLNDEYLAYWGDPTGEFDVLLCCKGGFDDNDSAFWVPPDRIWSTKSKTSTVLTGSINLDEAC
jgi:hypothetical protein